MKKMIIYGKHSVQERLRLRPHTIKHIFMLDIFDSEGILGLIKKNSVPCKIVSKDEMSRKIRADRLQGIIAEIEPFQYTDIKKLLSDDSKNKLTWVILNGLNDPHNIGAILRTAACFGNFVLVIPKHRSCEINETVLHVSSGAENYVPVVCVANITNTLIQLKQNGYWIASADAHHGDILYKTSIPFPLCLILGSEGKGISSGLRKYIDLMLNIPMQGANLSFNVAASAAIVFYEITKQIKNTKP